MKDYSLPRKALLLWEFRLAIIELLILGICRYFYLKLSFLYIVSIVLTAVFIISLVWYLPAFLRSYKIRLSKDGVIIRRGVIIKNTHILPFSRLIYTQTLVTPLAKLLKLKAITLKAARNTIVVPEMSAEDADSLLALLANGDEE